MSEHSPLPWSADTTEPGELWIADSRRLSPVCMITGSGNVTERDRADAAFIVKAVNNHDALVKALKESRAALVALMDAVQASQKMNGREYVGLGIQVNDAIGRAWNVLASVSAPGDR